MYNFSGQAVSNGIAIGPVVRFNHNMIQNQRVVIDSKEEQSLYRASLIFARDELRRVQQIATGEAVDILEFQLNLLEDDSFNQTTLDGIAKGMSCVAAVKQTEQYYYAMFGQIDDDYIRERRVDISDLCSRLTNILTSHPQKRTVLKAPCILVSDFFYPSDLFSLDNSKILGFATDRGGTNTHASIIARNMGTPAVAQLGDGMADVSGGRIGILDAMTGTLTIDPTPEQMRAAKQKQAEYQKEQEMGKEKTTAPKRNAAETPIQVYSTANSSTGQDDIDRAFSLGADGIGLIRTDSMIVKGLNEDEQVEQLRRILKSCCGKKCIIRTFDPSSDEGAGWERIMERNSASRLVDIIQLRALLRVAAEFPNMTIAIPMLAVPSDWDECKGVIEQCKEQLSSEGILFGEQVSFGCVVDVPSAALQSGALLDRGAEFLVIDIADLTCFTCGTSRHEMSRNFPVDTSAVLQLVHTVVQECRLRNCRVIMTGITPSDIDAMTRYVRLGMRTFCTENACLVPLRQRLEAAYLAQSIL